MKDTDIIVMLNKNPEKQMKGELSEQSTSFGKRIDFHTHILPQMDDGSSSVDMSIQMLQSSCAQSVVGIVLTPHFYPTRDNPTHFLNKRKTRVELLCSEYQQKKPRLFVGAEVGYFEGLLTMSDLPQMRIDNSAALLIEMPMCPWSSRMIGDISELNRKKEYRVILAHAERYLPFGNLPAIRQLAARGVRMQISADAFTGIIRSRKALNLLDEGLVHVLGSDCHNITSRPPNINIAYEYIERKRGVAVVKRIINNGIQLLSPV